MVGVRGTASCCCSERSSGRNGPELSQADSRITQGSHEPTMPNLAELEIALTRKGERVFCGLSCREVPYSLSQGWGVRPGLGQSLLLPVAQGCCCVAPVAPRQQQGRCLVPASLLGTPSAPKSHPRVDSKLQDPEQKGCGQPGEVGCWSVF